MIPAGVVSAALGVVVACGADEAPVNTGVLPQRPKTATQTVTVTVEFPPDQNVQGTTNSIHVWFIEGDDAGANCADLVGGATDPHAGPLNHLGDTVEKGTDGTVDGTITAKGIAVGSPTLVYVEAVDDNGQVEWAGCAETKKGAATVALSKARVYDCTADGVKIGAPCDDGDPCTVGESCRDGECKNSKPRDCTALDADCSVGQCDPVLGCVKVPYNDGATCDDELYCTTEDICVNGDCVGTPKNCDTNSGGCRIGSVCSETQFGNCTTGTLQPYGTACNDELFCTTGDQCDFSGNCTGTAMDCSASGSCLTCSETTHSCTEPKPVGTSCSSSISTCVVGGSCDASGSCVGQPRDCSSYGSTNNCLVGFCDPTVGSCSSAYVLSGTPCNDGNPCTTETCSGSGSCTVSAYAPIGTPCGSPCRAGATCDGSGYCSPGITAPSGTSCDDGNPCTVSDICSGSICYGPSYATAGTPCTLAGCPNGAQCGSSGRCICK